MANLEAAIKNSIGNGDLEGLKTLLKGKNIGASLASGWTPLHHACLEGQDTIIAYLLQNGAPAECHHEFFTPLMALCSSSCCDDEKLATCAKALIKYNADINAMDKYKITPLIHACTKGHEKLVSALLDAQCDVNKYDNDGFSALHVVCMYNYPNLVQILLDHGADKNLKDRRGRLPLNLAVSKGADDIIAMLDKKLEPASHMPEETYVRKKSSFEVLLTELPCSSTSSGRDGFYNDVRILLSGMKLEQRTDLFLKKRVSLAQFINMKNDDLKDLGINFSSHRGKIITSNKRFICHPWSSNSLRQSNEDFIEIMDIVRSLANIVKQLHIIWATAVYSNERLILPTDKEDQKVDDLYQVVLRTRSQTKALIKELTLIQKLAVQLDKLDKVQPADHIFPMKQNTCISSKKIFLATAFCAFVVWKCNFVSMLRSV